MKIESLRKRKRIFDSRLFAVLVKNVDCIATASRSEY